MATQKFYTDYVEKGIMRDFYDTYYAYKLNHDVTEYRLRTCSATVGKVHSGLYSFTYLRSYNTIVAVIDDNTGEAVDVLRTVYGYTATSAQHIAKFLQDYPCWTRLYRTNIDRKGEYYTIRKK